MVGQLFISDENIVKVIDQKNTKFINPKTYKIQKQNEQFIKDFQKKVEQNRIKKLFTVNGYSLWSFFEPLILGNSPFHGRLSFPRYRRLHIEINKFNFILNREEPTEIIIENLDEISKQTIKKICETKGIELRDNSLKKRKKYFNKFLYNPFFINSYLRLRFFLRRVLSKKQKRGNKEILFLTSDRFNKQKDTDNSIFGPIIRKLKNQKKKYLLIDYDRTYKTSIFDLLRRFLLRPESKFIGCYYTKNVNKKTKDLYRSIKKRLNEIKNNQNFRNLFVYKGIDLWDLFEKQIDYIFKITPLFLADMLTITDELLKVEKPKVAVLVGESDFYSKALILNSKKYNIKTVTLQFGPIRKTFSDLNPTNDIIPDIKCVDGNYEKNIITNIYNYSKKIVKVTGEPRYDCLVKNNWDKKEIFRQLNLSSKRKILLFIDGDLRASLKFLPEIPNLTKNYKIQVIVKLHPDISNKRKRIYKKYLGCEKYIKIVDNFNTSKLVYISDVVTTSGSTVAIEAIIADKPLVLLDPFHINIEPHYAEEGGALLVHNEKDFRKLIKSCLFDRKYIDKLRITREKSKKLHTGYNPKGQATQEVVEIIERFL